MKCEFFGQCGSCQLFEYSYDEQIALKAVKIKEAFRDLFDGVDVRVVPTADGYFRNRVEFKLWHDKDESISFAMRKLNEPKGFVPIRHCSIANTHINAMMALFIPAVQENKLLRHKLFEVDFLSSSDGEILISLLYHKTLDAEWIEGARKLKEVLGCDIIGRSRGKKFVVDKEYVTETVSVGGKNYMFRHIENSFTQPNGDINQKIIAFLKANCTDSGHDLLELYCGMGNLTIPLAENFRRVLGIEVSKASIASARVNIEANGVENIVFARMSAEEFASAMDGVREFERLKEVDLTGYDFRTVLVDPPRSGLDKESLNLVKRFETILYISCNPETLKENLEALNATHTIVNASLFDQFAYTPHMEMGIVLKKRGLNGI